MKFARTFSIQPKFPSASVIEIETDIQPGLFFFALIGLADTSIRESRSRILSAIKNSGFQSPKSRLQKITALLRPAGVKKYGSIHDLAIAVSYLLTQERWGTAAESLLGRKICFLGELTLEGKIVTCSGLEQAIATAIREGFDAVFYPKGVKIKFAEVAHQKKVKLTPVQSLSECLKIISGEIPDNKPESGHNQERDDIPDVHLPKHIADGLILALGGGHHIMLFGEPGTGKTFCTSQAEYLLPRLTNEEIYERCLLGLNQDYCRPIRKPHPNSSFASILGSIGAPGEILQSHKGLLVMNEFSEFDRRTLETLREPLEERIVNLSRTQGNTLIPCDFTLIATTNLCRCGYYRSQTKKCTCSQAELHKYTGKLSGPILDRFEIRLNTNIKQSPNRDARLSLKEIKEKILLIRKTQRSETKKLTGVSTFFKNLPDHVFWENICADHEARRFLDQALSKNNMNQRMMKHLWSLAKSCADLRGVATIEKIDIISALKYRLEDPKDPL